MTAQDINQTPLLGPNPPGRSAWPTVLGAFALVSAVVNLANGISIAVRMFNLGSATASQPATSQPIPSPSLSASSGLTFGLLLSLWLLWAGIGLIRRKSWSGRSMLNWAAVTITWLGIVFTMNTMKVFAALQKEGPPEGWTFASFATAAVVVLIIGMVPSIVPPIFAVFWFGRRKIRDEMATWAACILCFAAIKSAMDFAAVVIPRNA